MRWILGGIVSGMVLGAVAIRLAGIVLGGAQVNTTAWDPLVLAGVPLLIAAFALLAAFLSGRKAARLDPAMVLRMET